MKLFSALFLTTLLTSAQAHVTANPSKGAAGSYFVAVIRVPHGCGESPTVKVALNLTSDVTTGATAQAVSGWKVTYGYPAESSGGNAEKSKESEAGGAAKIPNSVIWEATPGNELPHNQFQDFGISIKLPTKAQYNNTIYFPTMQYCKNGTADWTSWPGSPNGEDPKTPAPKVQLFNETDASKGGSKGSSAATSGMRWDIYLAVMLGITSFASL